MALLSFVDSAPRAYRLKAGNAYLTFSTSTGTSPIRALKGANSREAPANLKPVGTGPYRFVDFAPGDLVKGERNPAYHVPNRPYFDTIELKGGGTSRIRNAKCR